MPSSFRHVSVVVLTLAAAAVCHGAAPASLTAFLDQHCVECHDADVKKGGLDLQALAFDLADAATMRRWVRVFDRVHGGEMPPKKSDRPEAAALQGFLGALEKDLVQADSADIAQNGRVRSRRLTRVEYEYTVQDLLGIDIPLKELLPEDPASHGFQTVAEGQQLSHHQLARYLDVADLALEEAFKRALGEDATFKKALSPEQLARPTPGNYRGPDLRNGKSLSWPITLQFFGRLPATTVRADGWYRVTLKGVQAVNPGPGGAVWGTLRSGACYSNAPMLYMIGLVEATATPRDLVYEAWIQEDHMLELKPNDGTLKRAPSGAKGGNVSFKGRNLKKDGFAGIAHDGIEIERIYPMADRETVRRRLFGEQDLNVAEADRAAALDRLVAQFAQRAFRRPVTDAQMAPYRAIGRQALGEGEPLDEALRNSYRAVLCSPRFLTFIEAPGALDDHALASRLSYALWVSLPDAELAQLAAEGRLRQPGSLARQVERMLADPKSGRFVRSFTDQWLKLSQIDFTAPDPRQFPTFDPVVQESMAQETRAYVAELIAQDLGVTHLVDSDFAFLNERLARHYQMDTAVEPGFGVQRVALRPGEEKGARGGLITQGAILKVTADGTSTSPVVRGVFVNERLLGQPIPPPPPGIPAIEPDIRGATSIRDQLDKHRSNESCNACHAVIDPPGFALESFDPVGVWRTRYGKNSQSAAVNPAGQTPDGAAFADLSGWKRLYAERANQLAQGFAGQFLTYATGAPIRFSDRQALAEIVRKTEESGHGVRSLLLQAVLSGVFLNK